MGRRWKVEDSNAIAEIRLRCATELAQQPAYPEGKSQSNQIL